MPLKKIVIIGPESTGKSTLCEDLAAHYGTAWAPEYAREYLLTHGKAYQYNDLLTIAKGQLALEDACAATLGERIAAGRADAGSGKQVNDETRIGADQADVGSCEPANAGLAASAAAPGGRGGGAPVLFIDTDMYVMKVWSEFVFGKCDRWILDQIVRRKYDGYLLCRTDLPWTKDELREYPDLLTREKLFRIYKDCMINQATPWAEIGGNAGERLQTAVEAVGRLIH